MDTLPAVLLVIGAAFAWIGLTAMSSFIFDADATGQRSRLGHWRDGTPCKAMASPH